MGYTLVKKLIATDGSVYGAVLDYHSTSGEVHRVEKHKTSYSLVLNHATALKIFDRRGCVVGYVVPHHGPFGSDRFLVQLDEEAVGHEE
jgi:hypothetical protein